LRYMKEDVFATKSRLDVGDFLWKESVQLNKYFRGQPLELSIFTNKITRYPSAENITPSNLVGRVNIPADLFQDDGYNGDLPLSMCDPDVRAFLRLKIKPRGKDFPPEPFPVFGLTVKRKPSTCFGVDIDTRDGKSLYVTHTRPGAVAQYNWSARAEKQLMVTDFIVAVNGVHGDAAAMLAKCRTDATICMVCRRAIDITVDLERQDENVPLGLEFATEHVGASLLVTGICKGVATDCNERTKEVTKHILPGDRIVEVGGLVGTSEILRVLLERATGKVPLVIVRPVSCDLLLAQWRFEH